MKRAFVVSVAAASVVSAGGLIKQDTATKTLVLLDDWATIETHSILFDHVMGTLGHQLEFDMPGSTTGRVRSDDGLLG